MSPSPKTSGLIYLLLGVFLWSTAEVVTRAVIRDITPIQLAAVRFVLGGLTLAPFLVADLKRRGLRLERVVVVQAMWMAWIGIVGANLCYQYSLKHTGAAVVATVFGTNPLMVFILARLVLGEPMTTAKLVGVVLGFGGIVVLAMSDTSTDFTYLGFFLAVACSFFIALFTVLVKRVGGPFAGLPLLTLCVAFGAAYLVPVALVEGDASTLAHWPRIALPVAYLGIATTGLAYYFYFTGLQRVEATVAASTMFLKPPLATVLAAVFLGEQITWNLVAALVLIMGGLYLVIVVNRQRLARAQNRTGE